MYVFFRMELVNEKKKKRIKLLPPLSVLCTFAIEIEIFSLLFVVHYHFLVGVSRNNVG